MNRGVRAMILAGLVTPMACASVVESDASSNGSGGAGTSGDAGAGAGAGAGVPGGPPPCEIGPHAPSLSSPYGHITSFGSANQTGDADSVLAGTNQYGPRVIAGTLTDSPISIGGADRAAQLPTGFVAQVGLPPSIFDA